MTVEEPKYYCHLEEGRTKIGADIHTLKLINTKIREMLIQSQDKLETLKEGSWRYYYEEGRKDAYVSLTSIISNELNKEIGT